MNTTAPAQPRRHHPAPTYTLTLRPECGSLPADVRMRRALKCLRRVFGFKCVEIQQNNPNTPARPAGVERD